MTVRILLTMSRSWSEWSTTREALEKVHAEHPDAVLVHGAAARGDRQAAGIWRGLGGVDEPWPADWDHCAPDCRHKRKERLGGSNWCPYAGYRRNTAMVESAPDLVLAFIHNQSKGASHCASIAEDAGIPVVRYEMGGDAS